MASCRTDDTNAITLAEQNGYKVVYNAAELNDVPATAAGLHTLGLFWSSDMPYEIDRNPATTPSLYDMATKGTHKVNLFTCLSTLLSFMRSPQHPHRCR